MTKRPDPHLERIARALGEASARSKLGRWMTANHDDFAALLDEHGANWTVLTDTFKAEGLMPADARAATAKRTWQRVRQRVAAGAVKEQPAGRLPKTASTRPPRDDAGADTEPPFPPSKFKFATPRK
jgi:hypothetical protein